MTDQLTFDLPSITALGREDFFLSPSNANAVAMIEGWQNWPSGKLLLIGPQGAGKTHLAHVWAALSDAQIISAQRLSGADIPALAQGHVAVEDANLAAGNADAETALFHLHNLVLAQGNSLLITAGAEARRWSLELPDLSSRMQGTPAVTLNEPDDALLTAVLMKLLSDRQLSPTPDVLPYLARHMERDFAAAQRVVAALDTVALAESRDVNRKLAADVLRRLDYSFE